MPAACQVHSLPRLRGRVGEGAGPPPPAPRRGPPPPGGGGGGGGGGTANRCTHAAPHPGAGHTQPWFRGEYHQIEGSIVEIGNEGQPLYTISGNWKRQVVATNTATKEKTVIYSVETKVHDYQTKALEEQSELESLRCAGPPFASLACCC